MKCLCGYLFAAVEQNTDNDFALIRNRDYQSFLKLEQRVLAAKTEEESLSPIAKSARLVGNVKECPECGRVVITPAGEDGPAGYFTREAPLPW